MKIIAAVLFIFAWWLITKAFAKIPSHIFLKATQEEIVDIIVQISGSLLLIIFLIVWWRG